MEVWLEVLGKLLLASVLGGLIGWEREQQRKPARLRTQMLVSLAAALFVLGARQAALAAGEPIDAGRAMAGIAQGVGFLGAGLILRARGQVLGLTYRGRFVGFCSAGHDGCARAVSTSTRRRSTGFRHFTLGHRAGGSLDEKTRRRNGAERGE